MSRATKLPVDSTEAATGFTVALTTVTVADFAATGAFAAPTDVVLSGFDELQALQDNASAAAASAKVRLFVIGEMDRTLTGAAR
jgi:hypothetical protein